MGLHGASSRVEAAEERNFSFVHASDIHVDPWLEMPGDSELESARSFRAVQTINELGNVYMEPFETTAPKPSFVIVTGDIAEFSFPGVTWDIVDRYFRNADFPIRLAAGNHDNTWVSTPHEFRKRYGGINYSFDHAGCHFIALNSASLQDPNPSFSQEVLTFLEGDLRKLDKSTPVFIYFHHPLDGKEFASRYDADRILDSLRPYNLVLILDGHGHNARRHDFWGTDGVMGGSTFSKFSALTDGYNIVHIEGNELRVAYKRAIDTSATRELLRKEIPARPQYPEITIRSPGGDEPISSGPLRMAARIKGKRIERAYYELDDETSGELRLAKGRWRANIKLNQIANGAHYLRLNFEARNGKTFSKTTRFYVEKPDADGEAKARWRYSLRGGSRATPLLHEDHIYLGANDGIFYALQADDGKLAWKFDARAEIVSSAAVWEDLILFGAADGKFHALTRDGESKWVYEAERPIMSSPVVSEDGKVLFGTNDARLVALDASSGQLLWTNEDAAYNVEIRPVIHDAKVYYGAWDGNLYCLDLESGKRLWSEPGPHNQSITGVLRRYYAPADNAPCIAGDNLFVTDRAYVLGRYTAGGDFQTTIAKDCSAVAVSQDGKSLYIRSGGGPVSKIAFDGTQIWQSDVVAGRIPVSPAEKDKVVYVCTNTGTLHALDADSGKLRWQYQVSPKLYIMAGVTVGSGVVYTVGLDGVVTAVEFSRARELKPIR